MSVKCLPGMPGSGVHARLLTDKHPIAANPVAPSALLQAVFQRGLAHVPEALRQDNPADVPAILAAWIAGEQAAEHRQWGPAQ
jgi:hypothetical protein